MEEDNRRGEQSGLEILRSPGNFKNQRTEHPDLIGVPNTTLQEEEPGALGEVAISGTLQGMYKASP